ncbi:thiamine diphosphate-binding protein [Pleurotus eryngii]|uniref:Thiamine diphosphate-binding protein n=1 Tax=Pleurotus eryngii TaxID=5323 RepID=A0A9P5ZNF1_PLEER|nr:thiamine diphosphate-binding protein [Pleurotus eryngii]
MYTASSVFLQTLADVGITHAFVNWGSDHPGILEDLERQRVENGRTALTIVTCPNEMVALSAAQGYAQVCGKPAAVIVHVDVGTQAMAGAIHNVDRGQTPVLIYAGASPFSLHREHEGARNEFIMWMQDIPDQAAIVRQYMRNTTQLHSGKDMPSVIRRSLQIATSEPKGPVYLWARREVMEAHINPDEIRPALNAKVWPAISPAALSPSAVSTISCALLSAETPLIITSYLGRNKNAVTALMELSLLLAIPVALSCPSAVNIPSSFPNASVVTYLWKGTHHPGLETADVILVINSDTPWIPENTAPNADAKIFVIDGGDVLKKTFGYNHSTNAEMVCNADAEVALKQIIDGVKDVDEKAHAAGLARILGGELIQQRAASLAADHSRRVRELDIEEDTWPAASADGSPTLRPPNVLGVLRKAIQEATPSRGENVLILNEGISHYNVVWDHMRSDAPGGHLTSGGSSLGWSLGAAIGAMLAEEAHPEAAHDLVAVIVGDGSFLFCVPSSAYWMAQRQKTPYLTIVLNNGGWKSPKISMLGVHPSGHGSAARGDRLSVGFGPVCPDYSQLAVAASGGWAWGRRLGLGEDGTKEKVENAVKEALRVVLQEKRCAIIDCVVETI